jgi:hypothetical protein
LRSPINARDIALQGAVWRLMDGPEKPIVAVPVRQLDDDPSRASPEDYLTRQGRKFRATPVGPISPFCGGAGGTKLARVLRKD